MDRIAEKERLKAILLRDVKYLCIRKDLLWSEPIAQTLRDLRESQTPAVFFGGTLRSLLLSRLRGLRLIGRPRDLDIVVAGLSIDRLREKFRSILSRETRFGGLHLQRANRKFDVWHFDVWPLNRTWAFAQDNTEPAFSALPFTTFFNLEAIAVDVWATPGHTRKIYSGDDQFFDGLLTKTLEINREDNPFPSLCVVRALVLASTIDFAIGPRLARFLATIGPTISDDELEAVQKKHYGKIRAESEILRSWIVRVTRSIENKNESLIKLPRLEQGTLWPEEGEAEPALHMHILNSKK